MDSKKLAATNLWGTHLKTGMIDYCQYYHCAVFTIVFEHQFSNLQKPHADSRHWLHLWKCLWVSVSWTNELSAATLSTAHWLLKPPLLRGYLLVAQGGNGFLANRVRPGRDRVCSVRSACMPAVPKLSSFFFIPWQTFAKWEIEYISAEGTHLRPLHFADAAHVFEWTWLFAAVVHKRGPIMWCSKTRLIHFPCGILICVCGCQLSGRTATFRCFFFTWEEGLPSISTHS